MPSILSVVSFPWVVYATRSSPNVTNSKGLVTIHTHRLNYSDLPGAQVQHGSCCSHSFQGAFNKGHGAAGLGPKLFLVTGATALGLINIWQSGYTRYRLEGDVLRTGGNCTLPPGLPILPQASTCGHTCGICCLSGFCKRVEQQVQQVLFHA